MANGSITWDSEGRAYGDLFDKQYALNSPFINLPTVPPGSVKQVILPYFVTRAILTYQINFDGAGDILIYKSTYDNTTKTISTSGTAVDDLSGGLGHGMVRLTGFCSSSDSGRTTWLAETIHFPS